MKPKVTPAGGEELELESGEPKLAAVAFGPKNGIPVLALHGWLDNAASFAALAPFLPELRIVALDLPGHGMSAHRPPNAHYHLIDLLPDALRAADALGWSKFSLLSHSMGAGAAVLLAGAAAERIEALVAIEAIGPLTDEGDAAAERMSNYLKAYPTLATKRVPTYESAAGALAARLRSGEYGRPDGIQKVIERGIRQNDDGRWTWRTDPRLTVGGTPRLTKKQVLSFAKRITCPVLYLRAEPGLALDPVTQAEFAAAIPRLRAVALPGGHHLHLDEPGRVAPIIQDFFRRAGVAAPRLAAPAPG